MSQTANIEVDNRTRLVTVTTDILIIKKSEGVIVQTTDNNVIVTVQKK